MSGRTAKRIRREVYGEYSQGVKEQKVLGKKKFSVRKGKMEMVPVMVVNVGLREAYQKAKKEYNSKRR